MAWPTEDEDEMREARTEALERILDSETDRKLVIGGPGTGKTYTFEQVIDGLPDDADVQILSFLRLLVEDLSSDLGDQAEVSTFHGYCKRVLHENDVPDISRDFDYYPYLKEILADDMAILSGRGFSSDDLERRFHLLDTSDGVLDEALGLGSYYDAVTFEDSVYRVLSYFRTDNDHIPNHDLVIVDEYQDFNKLETEFLELLSEQNAILFAGDDDQALYAPYRRSSPDFIRDLYGSESTSEFELPYCSRCPEPVVKTVNQVVELAQERDLLLDRIPKPFICFTPDKREVSEAHPNLIHAHCTVERSNAPYMGRYVKEQVGLIPQDEIQESHEEGYPTALVIGPKHIVSGVYEELEGSFADVTARWSEEQGIDVLDGLERLANDPESRLGWRIVLKQDPPDDYESIIEDSVPGGELADNIPANYASRYLDFADLLGRVKEGDELTEEETERLEDALGRSFDSIRSELVIADETEDSGDPPNDEESESQEPEIICTTFPGAKGLSAAYVFIVGMVNDHFPRDPASPTNQEIRSLVVALSRTRTECHLVSCGNYAGSWVNPSIFLDWLPECVSTSEIDADYWD